MTRPTVLPVDTWLGGAAYRVVLEDDSVVGVRRWEDPYGVHWATWDPRGRHLGWLSRRRRAAKRAVAAFREEQARQARARMLEPPRGTA